MYALQTRPGSLPGGEYMAWLGNWLWVPAVFLIGTFMVLLFPDGRLPSRRWRVVAWLSVAAPISVSVSYAFLPGRLDEAPNVTNPLGIESAGSALEFVYTWDLLLLPLCFVASALSMVLRFRRSTGEVRQQIKWFAAAAVLQTMAFSFYFVVPSGVIEDFVALAFAGLPVAVGIAILRHRLYDIDVVINRPSLRLPHRDPYSGLRWKRGDLALPLPRPHRPGGPAPVSHSRLHPRNSRAVQPAQAPHPVVHRPPLLPQQV